jgi:hypothetical protein
MEGHEALSQAQQLRLTQLLSQMSVGLSQITVVLS